MNSFEIRSIRKLAIRLIRNGKKYSKNSMKINSKFVRFDSTTTIGWNQMFQMLDSFKICSIRFDSNYRVEPNYSDAGFVRNSFDSIRKFLIGLIRKVKNNSKNSIKINSKLVRFYWTPTIGWNQIFRNWNSFDSIKKIAIPLI